MSPFSILSSNRIIPGLMETRTQQILEYIYEANHELIEVIIGVKLHKTQCCAALVDVRPATDWQTAAENESCSPVVAPIIVRPPVYFWDDHQLLQSREAATMRPPFLVLDDVRG